MKLSKCCWNKKEMKLSKCCWNKDTCWQQCCHKSSICIKQSMCDMQQSETKCACKPPCRTCVSKVSGVIQEAHQGTCKGGETVLFSRGLAKLYLWRVLTTKGLRDGWATSPEDSYYEQWKATRELLEWLWNSKWGSPRLPKMCFNTDHICNVLT